MLPTVLGIESTAHTFGVSIIRKKEVLSNIKDTFTTETGGLIPVQLAEHHVDVCDKIILKALRFAKISINDIDVIAYSKAPGMGHALRFGAMAARSLSLIHNIPLVGVHHSIAHLEIGRLLTEAKDPVFLDAAGSNTNILAYHNGRYRIMGETLDTGVGNFLDKFGRELGFGFPGGPKVYKTALKGKNLLELPYVVKGMDVSFGGILTHLKTKIKKGYSKEDLCFSAQETVFAMLIEVSERALAHTDKKELLLGGGVACNRRLQEMAKQMCESRGARCYVPTPQYLTDNAAMIAWLGSIMYMKGHILKAKDAYIDPYLRPDQVEVDWY